MKNIKNRDITYSVVAKELSTGRKVRLYFVCYTADFVRRWAERELTKSAYKVYTDYIQAITYISHEMYIQADPKSDVNLKSSYVSANYYKKHGGTI